MKRKQVDDIRPEYPPELIRSGDRGRYVVRHREGTTIGLMEPELQKHEPLGAESGSVRSDSSSGLSSQALKASGLLSEEPILDFGPGFWRKDRRLSGRRIDVLRGQNIPGNSRVIDRTLVPGGVVSHKSTDVRRKSYRRPSSVYRMGMRFARALAAYRGEVRQDHRRKATYHLHWAVEDRSVRRILEWFIPASGVSREHRAALEEVVRDAAQLGVVVRLLRVRDYSGNGEI